MLFSASFKSFATKIAHFYTVNQQYLILA